MSLLNNGGDTPSNEDLSSNELFNEPIPVQTEESNLIPMRFNFSHNDEDEDEDEPDESNKIDVEKDSNNKDENLNNGFESIIKDEELEKLNIKEEGKKEEEDVDTLIEKLKAKGIEVKKPEEQTPESEVEKQKLERIDNFIKLAEDFMKQDDLSVIKDSLINEVSVKYERLGKKDLIGTEEFDLEVEMELSEYENNPRAAKSFADNIRLNISEKINLNKNEKEKIINQKTEAENLKKLEEKKIIRDTISKFNNKKLFGIEANQEILQDVYNSIISNDIAKTVNSNPEILAEIAFYVKNRDTIKENFGKATFGEGVKAVVDEISGKNSQQTPSSLNNAMNTKSNGTGNMNKRSLWSDDIVVEDKPENKSTFVAGSSRW